MGKKKVLFNLTAVKKMLPMTEPSQMHFLEKQGAKQEGLPCFEKDCHSFNPIHYAIKQ